MKRIAFIPLDNRPVSYDLPVDIISCSKDFELLIPPIEYIGGLYNVAQYDKLINWLKNTDNVDYVVVALDTIAYGSLVASRRCSLSYEEVKNRIEKLKDIIIKKKTKTFAFSSIMRISNNNVNEEEKDYWNLCGKKIFEYSFNTHKAKVTNDKLAQSKANEIKSQIPDKILEDYVATRERNFKVNKLYLDILKQGVFEYVVFSKDDCAQFGFNVKEAAELNAEINKHNINAMVKTGADEIPLALLSRIYTENKNVKIYPKFAVDNSKGLISKYEDISIEKSVFSQIELAGAKIVSTEEQADLILYINNFENEQGELVMNVDTKPFFSKIPEFTKNYFIADVRYANGADNEFIKVLLNNDLKSDKFYGYAGWNTSANTLGSGICIALSKYCSENFNKDNFLKLQAVRLLDDWAYQANVRKLIRDNNDNLTNNILNNLMKDYEKIVSDKLGINLGNIDYTFPWERFFEIRIKMLNS